MRWVWLAGAALSVAASSLYADPSTAPITLDRIEHAAERGRQFLYSLQNPDGWWEVANRPRQMPEGFWSPVDKQWGSLSALATWAATASGEHPQHAPRIAALNRLKGVVSDGNYATSLRGLALAERLLERFKHGDAIRASGVALLAAVIQRGPGKGFWRSHRAVGGPWPTTDPDAADLPASHLAAVAIAAMAPNFDPPIPQGFWAGLDGAWRAAQLADGSWPLNPGDKTGSPAMTAAGVEVLCLAADQPLAGRKVPQPGNVIDQALSRAVSWLGNNWAEALKARPLSYTRYLLVRAARASGTRLFAGHDWFAELVGPLLDAQKADGSWDFADWPATAGLRQHGALLDTCLSLLLLGDAGWPVRMNKLRYSIVGPEGRTTEGPWNQRPRDVASFARFLGPMLCCPPGDWQTVSFDTPLDLWLDAPILFVAGDQPLFFTDAQMTGLRQYVHRGGLILGSADAGQAAFADSYQVLGAKLFPGCQFRRLPTDHAIYTSQIYPGANWKTRPDVVGLSNGVRELMILVRGADLSAAWQTSAWRVRPECFELPGNLYPYTGRLPLHPARGESAIAPVATTKPAGVVRVARLSYAGNWNPEPLAWECAAVLMHNRRGLDVRPDTVELGKGRLGADYRLAHLTGTAELKLDDVARAELRKFLQGGGLLLVDAAGGSLPFADSARRELAALLPASSLQHVTPDHPLLRGWAQQQDWTRSLRRAARKALGKVDLPPIDIASIDGGLAVVFSPIDIATGLAQVPNSAVVGYTPDAATALLSAILDHAVKR
jgi:hypothetical protein